MLIEPGDLAHRGVIANILMYGIVERAIESEKEAWVLKTRNPEWALLFRLVVSSL